MVNGKFNPSFIREGLISTEKQIWDLIVFSVEENDVELFRKERKPTKK